MAGSSKVAHAETASSHNSLNRLLFLVGLLPMVLIGVIISHYGVNVPYGDEWSIIPLVGKWDSHQLSFADFYVAHNGHRIVIPRLIYLTLIQLTHGNLRAEMFFSLFLCILTSVGIYLLLQRTVSGSIAKHLALWALINLFLFSPIQAENWLWGFQLQVFLSNLCLAGAIVSITSTSAVLPRFAGALAFALAGTFSFGNGVLIWPAIFVVLVCRGESVRVKGAWIVIAVLVMLAYLPGYPPREPTPAAIRWFDYLLYFAGFLGAPLARIPNSQPLALPVILGSILLAAYFGFAASLLRHREIWPKAAPWLGLGGYVIASAAMASFARIHSGPMHALDSRYTTVSVMLLVSLIGLWASINRGQEATSSWPVKRSVLVGAGVASLLFLYAINAPFELRYLRLNHSFRERGKGALQFSAVLDLDQLCRGLLLIRQDPETLTRSLGVLDRLRLLDPPRRQTPALNDGENRPGRTADEHGMFEDVRLESEGVLAATGWCYLPATAGPAASVILACRDGSNWKAFALSDVTQRRPDLAARFKTRSYLETGWRFTFPRSVLPLGEQEISAWALEADSSNTYRLPGSFKLER